MLCLLVWHTPHPGNATGPPSSSVLVASRESYCVLWASASERVREGAGCETARRCVQAKALGYTEPDPRDDLAGMDVARKVTILAR